MRTTRYLCLFGFLCLYPFYPLFAGEGTQWLESRAQNNGAITAPADIASPLQATTEALRTFAVGDQAIDPVHLDLTTPLDYLAADADGATETLVRQLIVLSAHGRPTNNLAVRLLQRRQRNGGFAHLPGHEATSLDTALALEAMALVGMSGDAAAGAAILYLTEAQLPNGGWSLSGGQADTYVTALAMRAVWHYRHMYTVSASLASSEAFLLAQRDSEGLWGDTFVSALSLIALAPTEARSALGSAATALAARQLPNGSYDNGVYQTALALRALRFLALPLPDEIMLSGRIIDGDSALPLGNVSVTLTGATNQITTTLPDGTFRLSQLSAGAYNLGMALDGYSSLFTQINLTVGQQSDFGDLSMLPQVATPTTGRLIGTVRDAETQLGLPGVTILLSGSTDYQTETDVQGAYQVVNIQPGAYALQTTAAGYISLGGEITFQAGQTQVFSPDLQSFANVAVSVEGTVTSRDTGLPLEGVAVTAETSAGLVTTHTSPVGTYVIDNLPPGLLTLTGQLAGFLTAGGEVTTTNGSRINFSPSLQTEGTPPEPGPGGILGMAFDRATGLGFPGVTVSLQQAGGSHEVLSGEDGEFALLDLPPGEGTLTLEATGYRTVSTALAVIADTHINLGEVALLPDDYQLSSGITGRVVDTRTQLPLGGVMVDAVLTGGNHGFVTTDNGTFEFLGLVDETAELTFFIAGYDPVALDTLLAPGIILALGDIYLRGDDLDNLLPDAAVQGLDGTDLLVDPQSFELSGRLSVTLANRGNALIDVPLTLTAFYDTNGNGALDAQTDTVLGTISGVGTLAPDASATEQVPVTGLLPFRDAPISVWVDAREVLVESSESNNLSSTADLCSNQNKPNVDLAFCLDGSGSVSRSDFLLQLEGTALAVENPDIVPRDGSVRITVIQFSSFARVELEPVIVEADNAATVVANIRAIRKLGGGTAIHRGIDAAVAQISAAVPVSSQQVIDVSTDGGSSLSAALSSVSRAQTAGIDTLNAIGVGSANIGLLEQIVYPQPAGGDRGFVIDVNTFEEYVIALSGKVEQEVKIADLSMGGLRLLDAGLGQPIGLCALVGNGGSVATPNGITAAFYDGAPNSGGLELGSVTLGTVAPGGFVEITLAGLDPAQLTAGILYAVVDPGDALPECAETNNSVAIEIRTTLGTISLVADEPAYPAETDARFTLTISNIGAVQGAYSADLLIADIAGESVVRFRDLDPSLLAGGEAVNLDQIWNTAQIAAGPYTATAILYDLDAQELDRAQVPFAIISGGSLDVSAWVTTDRALYGAWDQVLLESFVENLTSNLTLGVNTATLRVYAPNGTPIFSNDYDLLQLLPGSRANFPGSLVLSDASSGVYTVELELRDAGTGDLTAQAASQFAVNRESGDGLLGQVTAAPEEVTRGKDVFCTENISNQSDASAGFNRISRLVHLDSNTVISEVSTAQTLIGHEGWTRVQTLDTGSLAAGFYACLLVAESDGIEQTLDAATFLVNEPDCGACNGQTVTVDQSTVIDFSQNPPLLSGDADLLPFFTFETLGDAPQNWRAHLDLEGANLEFTQGATLTIPAVTAGRGGGAPSLILRGVCNLSLPTGAAIQLQSENHHSGDLIVETDGDILIDGLLEQRVNGSWGVAGKHSVFSLCGNITIGPEGLVFTRGSQEGARDISVVARHGNIAVNGGLRAEFSHGRSPNILVEATQGDITVDGNNFQDEGVAKRGPIYSGITLVSESTPDMGAIQLIAGGNLLVQGFGPNLSWDEPSINLTLERVFNDVTAVPVSVTLTNVAQGVAVDLVVPQGSGFPMAFFGNFTDELLLDQLAFTGSTLGKKSAVAANAVDGLPNYWMSPPDKWDFGVSFDGSDHQVSFVLEAPGLTWPALTAGQHSGFGLGVIVAPPPGKNNDLVRMGMHSPQLDGSQRGTVAIIANGARSNWRGGTIMARAFSGDLTALDWAFDQRNNHNGTARLELEACGTVTLGTSHQQQALAESGRIVLDSRAEIGGGGEQQLRSSGSAVVLEAGAAVLAGYEFAASPGTNDLVACDVVDLQGLLFPNDIDPANDSGFCHLDAPAINSPPVIQAQVGSPYTYAPAVAGSGLDGAPAWAALLPSAPVGMVFDHHAGALTWTPRPDQVGIHGVVLHVYQGCGVASQTFVVEVTETTKQHRDNIELERVKK